ncbi:cytochrome c (plasmid) [Ensifer adhaerens]|nr:cytochrome c [Ensifer adhaerens]
MPALPWERTRVLQVAAVFLLLHSGQSGSADLARGRAIANRWCSECHVTAPGQQRGSDNVPTFSEMKKSGKLDTARLSTFLSAPQHSRMPDLSLTRTEIADLTAYIMSQGQRP